MNFLSRLSKLYKFIRIRCHRYPRFPLLNLPYVAIKHVITTMSVSERIKLSLTSKRMEAYVILSRQLSPYCIIHFDSKLSYILMSQEGIMLFSENKFHKYCDYGNEKMKYSDYSSWLNKNSTSLEKFSKLTQKVLTLFPTNYLILQFCTDWMSAEDLEALINIPIFRGCNQLEVFGQWPRGELLDMIMEMANSKGDIKLGRVMVDYSHAMAFKFRNIVYDDSRWIRIEHLLSLENSRFVTLRQCNLNCKDMNILLKYWISTDRNMFEVLKIEGNERFFCPKDVFDGIAVLRAVFHENPYYWITTKSADPSKRNMLACQLDGRTMQCFTGRHDKIRITTGVEDLKVLEILKLLEDRREEKDQEHERTSETLNSFGVLFKDGIAWLR
ncbi:hypothetical protein GCK72_004447 [Caenorhabditis remanei]|uniref:F-box domain-containing protein n=1 Tax=Caenorhabditis remanei TaxID=31234 RepID=E3NG43_CAERE|nr:hypothetical protein GCK72_004447 [Caenorhabditis remanei]EFO96933.1 hypothetical protein CRE_09821 [Caenorhabditis remanei]KAF1764499.1 hypothetical protein GCK72_004447 [Caenorhabditis remanei]